MNRQFFFLFLFSYLTGPFFSQSPQTAIIRAMQGNGAEPPVMMNDAYYDASRDMLPYYVISRHTAANVIANASLVVKKTRMVDAATSRIIIRELGKHLTGSFTIEARNGIARGENTNTHRIVPLRITPDNRVEELLEYDVTWRKRTVSSGNITSRKSTSFASVSVLATGTWYKIGVTRTGIHRVSRAFLSTLGINSANLSPASIRVFGNGGAMLPELNKAPRIDDLAENPLLVVDGGDGVFDNADYFLFYATGPTEWKRAPKSSRLKYQASKNLYSDTSFYFISVDYTEGAPRRIQVQPSGSGENTSSSSYDYYNFHEEDLYVLAKSGRQHFGESFDIQSIHSFNWADGNFVVGDSVGVECILAANYETSPAFEVRGNGLSMMVTTGAIAPQAAHPEYARIGMNSTAGLNNAANQLAFTVEKKTTKALGWLDKITVNARRQLVAGSRQFNFRDTRSFGPGKIVRYNISTGAPQGVHVWNVTSHLSPYIQAYNVSSNGIDFVAPSDTIVSEYCIAPAGDLYVPTAVGKIANQNLHGIQHADYLIVCHPLFTAEAERLGAFHQKQEGYTYAVATVDQIYNEFSSGRPDISAIRDFIRMVYTRNAGGRQVQYVCLMGDGSYNNKSRNLVNNSNLIPTYQSLNSVSPIQSVTSDDFFAMMDPEEGLGVTESSTDLVDVGVGRLTCRTVAEVRAVLAKIEHYYSRPPEFRLEPSIPISYESSTSTLGDWRTWLLFMADDGDGALHMWQSDTLARIVQKIAPGYNSDKIMLDAYQRFSTPGGNRFPDAADEFMRRLRKGALLFNYTGHGGEVGLTAERMVDVEMINSLDNYNQLSLFITATCEFSRYDDPNRTSAGELSLLNPKGAAIALMTTCRLAFSSTNLTLNKQLVKKIFTFLPDGRRPALGDIMRLTKTSLGNQDFYYAHFHLLGDPALRLAYPEYHVRTTKIGDHAIDPLIPDSAAVPDTLRALAKVTVEGEVTDAQGNKLDFNGVVYPTVFDKEQDMRGLVNAPFSAVNYYEDPDEGPCDTCSLPFTFNLQKNILYRGKAQVQDGKFQFTFIVPKDISFAHGTGKISYYATTGGNDAMGYHDNLVVGGESSGAIPDNAGPQISLFLNEKNFVNGGTTDEKPILYADLIDSSGINTSGIGLGHDITVILDKESSKPVVLNDYYEANLNSYQSGRIRYPFTKIDPGPHTLTFKVWDIQNNSSSMALDFIVAEKAEVALKHVLNYPNPFTSRTKFFFEHNQSGVPLKVHIQVFTVTGKLVKTIQQTVVSDSFVSEGIDWDGRDDYGDKLARGVYIYRLAILDINNKKAEKLEKLVILN